MATFGIVVNQVTGLKASQTTVELAFALAKAGHRVGLIGADGFDVFPGPRVVARVRRLTPSQTDASHLARVKRSPARPLDVTAFDALLVRTNPGRDKRPGVHGLLLQQLELAEEAGVLVLNAPRGLRVARSKLYLTRFPEGTIPATVVTSDPDVARDAVRDLGGAAVLKPLDGTQGRDVFKLTGHDDHNLSALLANLLSQGPVMVQEYVREAPQGDVRILLVDGRAVEIDGAAAVVRRRPAAGEFRSNVHLGGTPERAELTPDLRQLVKAVGPRLRRDGLFFVGLDVVGDRIVECNVFSPGGLGDAGSFVGKDFSAPLVDAVEDRLERHQQSVRRKSG